MLLDASRVTMDKVVSGALLLTNRYIYFHPRKIIGGLAMAGKTKHLSLTSLHDRKWNLLDLHKLFGRRYLLQNCAIEMFFLMGLNVSLPLQT